MSRKKILFVMESLQINGASLSLLALLKAIEFDYDISLFLFSHSSSLLWRIPSSVKLLPEKNQYKVLATQMKVAVRNELKHLRLGNALLRLRVWLDRGLKRPFSHWNCLPPINGDWDLCCGYSDGFVAQVVIRKVNARKKVLWVHEDYEKAPRGEETLGALRNADAVVGVSEDSVRHIHNVLRSENETKLYVVHNIVDPKEVFRLSQEVIGPFPKGSLNIVSIGRISKEKGYDRIPAILEVLKNNVNGVNWTIVGPGLDSVRKAIEVDAEKRGVALNIHFIGGKTNPYPYIAVADILVQLSRNEGWCMAISEALSLGKPVVANDIPVFHEQIFDGENGYLVGGNDTDFAVAIQKAYSEKHLQGWAERNKDKLPFTPDNVQAEFERVISENCR